MDLHPILLKHVQKGGLPRIVEPQEKNLGILVVQPCTEGSAEERKGEAGMGGREEMQCPDAGEEGVCVGAGDVGDVHPNPTYGKRRQRYHKDTSDAGRPGRTLVGSPCLLPSFGQRVKLLKFWPTDFSLSHATPRNCARGTREQVEEGAEK